MTVFLTLIFALFSVATFIAGFWLGITLKHK